MKEIDKYNKRVYIISGILFGVSLIALLCIFAVASLLDYHVLVLPIGICIISFLFLVSSFINRVLLKIVSYKVLQIIYSIPIFFPLILSFMSFLGGQQFCILDQCTTSLLGYVLLLIGNYILYCYLFVPALILLVELNIRIDKIKLDEKNTNKR